MSTNKFYSSVYKIFVKGIKWFFNIHVEGSENEPKDGAYIACANHISLWDVLIVGSSVERQVHFIAKAELFKIPLVSNLIRALGAYPVDRKGSDVSAIKKTISILKDGDVVGFFPQGTRYKGVDPKTTPLKNGVAMITYHSKVTVLPMYIQTKNYKLRPFHRTNITIGKPILYEDLNFNDTISGEYQRVTKKIFDNICYMAKDNL